MRRCEYGQVEMQIAPLIDVCFLLLFFYILTSKPEKPEGLLGMNLPGTLTQETTVDLPDEQRVEILANGGIFLNQTPISLENKRGLAELTTILSRYRESAFHNHASAPISIVAADEAPHQKLVDVLNACALAGIQEVTFAGIEDQMP